MPSLHSAYLRGLTFGASELSAIHRLGESRGRQDLFVRQLPEQLNTLRTHAIIESTESSNRIEGVVAAPGRVADLVVHRTEPRTRSEQEIAGCRDALQLIHESHADMRVRGSTFEPLHKTVPAAAAAKDPTLYELLVLIDAIRDGRARERKAAELELAA